MLIPRTPMQTRNNPPDSGTTVVVWFYRKVVERE
jgi:hypothetical protein